MKVGFRRTRSLVRWSLACAVAASAALGALAACSSGGGDDLPSTGSDGGDDHAALPTGDGGAREGGGEGGALTEKEACETYFKATCARYAECGVVVNCDTYLSLCPDYLFAPGSTRGIDDTLACAVVRRNQDCAEVQAGINPPCATAGTRKKGEPCDFGGQCESFSCTTFGACGTCLGLTPPNSGCPKPGDSCAINHYCPSEDAGCVPKPIPEHLPSGAVCPQPDGGGLTCPIDFPCTAQGPLADAGACTARPTSGACAFPLQSARAYICGAGLDCTRVDAAAPNGTCAAGAPQGSACGGAIGVTCEKGLYCTGSGTGTCQPQGALNTPCTMAAQCTEGTYCHFTSQSQGTCVAGAAIGAPCGPTSPDAGPVSDVACAQGICNTITTDAGPSTICTNAAAGDQEACNPPLSPCALRLECGADGHCGLPPCINDAGSD